MRYSAFLKNKSGFTIVELILVVALLATISGFGYAGYQQFNQDKDLNLATADFINTLNEAKTDTQTQINASTCQGAGTVFAGYQILFNGAGAPYTSYKLQLVCKDSTTGVATTYDQKTIKLPSSVTLGVNKVTYGDGITNPDNNTILTPLTPPNNFVLFAYPNAASGASYAATLIGKSIIGVGIDPNGVILQCDSECQANL